MSEDERKRAEIKSILKIAGIEEPKKKQARKPKEEKK